MSGKFSLSLSSQFFTMGLEGIHQNIMQSGEIRICGSRKGRNNKLTYKTEHLRITCLAASSYISFV